jgi:hypothetical protein
MGKRESVPPLPGTHHPDFLAHRQLRSTCAAQPPGSPPAAAAAPALHPWAPVGAGPRDDCATPCLAN